MAVKRSQSGARILAVLETIAAHQPVGVRAVAKLLECDKSAVQRAIMTLADEGWLRPTLETPVRWQLTPRILAVAHLAQGGDDLRQRARSALELLRDETGETALLVVPDARQFVIADVAESRQMLRMAPRAGIVVTPRDTATGRAILPLLAADRRTALLGEDPDQALLDNYALTKQRGFALSEGEINPGATSIAAPIFGAHGEPIGALAIIGPRERLALADCDAIGTLVARQAGELSRGTPATSG